MTNISDLRNVEVLMRKASDLLNYCLAKKGRVIEYNAFAINGFIDAAYETPLLNETWSFTDAHNILLDLLGIFSENNKNINPPVTENKVIDFIEKFFSVYSDNISDYWIVIPLMKAKVSEVYKFSNYLFIPEMMERNEKLTILSNLIDLPPDEIIFRAAHTEQSRSPSFYDYTLLCHHIHHHYYWINQMCSRVALLDIAILRTINQSLTLNSSQPWEYYIEDYRKINRHILIHTFENSRWGHVPLWSNENSTVVLGGLEWLQQKEYQEKFVQLIELVGYEQEVDRLLYRFRRSIQIYSKSIDIRLGNRHTNEGYAMELLHLLIAAEGLLLERENEKRIRLAALLSRFVKIDGKTSEEIFKAINDIYTWRSDYVHSGKEVFPEYDENFEESETLRKIYLLRLVISKFLVDSNKWLSMASANLPQSPGTKAFINNENQWFSYVDQIWQSILSGAKLPLL